MPLNTEATLHDRIHVSVRLKPLAKHDPKKTPWVSVNDTTICNKNNKKESFTFDRIIRENVTTQEVFNSDIRRLVSNALKGYNVTIIAYGQTSTGKTHTIRGSEN